MSGRRQLRQPVVHFVGDAAPLLFLGQEELANQVFQGALTLSERLVQRIALHFGALALGDVADDCSEHAPAAQAQLADHHVQRKHRAILPPPDRFGLVASQGRRGHQRIHPRVAVVRAVLSWQQ